MKGRITKIERNTITEFAITTGKNKDQQTYYDNNPSYKGTGGTYSRPVHSETSIDVTLTIYGKTPADNKRVTFDIRDSILDANGKQRVSKQKLEEIIQNNVGNKVNFEMIDGRIIFDPGNLKL